MLATSAAAWIQFVVCAGLIAIAGTRLSRYGDVIAEKTGMSGAWIGVVLMASVTSLPELVTGISAVTLADAPDLAVGNVLGACVINLAMLAVLDAFSRNESIYTRATQGHILSAGFGVVFAGFVGINLLLAQYEWSFALGWIGAYSPLIVALYAVAVHMLFNYERRSRAAFVEERAERYPNVTLSQAMVRYALAAVVVVAAGLWLPYAGEAIARSMGWDQTFVGTSLMALATTLPELTVTIAAVRIGALDLAVSNLLGSNLFNLAIVAVDDVFYVRGPLLDDVALVHAVSALSIAMMSGLVVVGLMYRSTARLFRTVGWTSVLLLSIYLSNLVFLYLYTQRAM